MVLISNIQKLLLSFYEYMERFKPDINTDNSIWHTFLGYIFQPVIIAKYRSTSKV